MADINVLSRLFNGFQRNVDMSTNTIVVGNIKIGGATNYATFDVSAVTGAKTITVPNTNIDLGDIATNTAHITSDGSSHSNVASLATLSGVAAGATNLGTFTGATIADSATIKAALQSLETALETVAGNEASAIGIDTGYTAASGNVVDTDNVLQALQKLDGNTDNLLTAVGIVQGALHLGAFTGTTIADDQTAKAALQALETAVEARIPSSEKGAVSGVATLDASGKLTSSQIPAIAITSTFVVATELAQLALTVEEGDVAVRSDLNKSYIALNADNVDMGDWQELLTPTDSVASVNGATGVVVLDTGDIAEGSNLYYTSARFDSAFGAKSTTDLSEGTNLYFTAARAIAAALTGFTSGAGTVAATDTVLEAIQKLDGNSLEIDANVNDLVTLSGVAENATHLGTFTGATIADSSTVKGAFQALETAVENIESDKIVETMIAGETFEANKTFIVRMAISGETAGRVYKADKAAGAPGSETFTIFAIGVAQNTTGTAISAGDSIVVTKLGEVTLQSADTAFGIGRLGYPLYLGSAGAIVAIDNIVGTANDADVWCGVVRTTTTFEVKQAQIMGIN